MIVIKFTSFHSSLGLDPNISGYEAVLCLYEGEAGPKPEKVSHVG